MDVDEDTIRSNLEAKESEELVALRNAGTLTDEARVILDQILESRGAEGLEHTEPPQDRAAPKGRPGPVSYVMDHFRGNRPLWSAFWIVGVGGFMVVTFIAMLLMSMRIGRGVSALTLAIGLVQIAVWLGYFTVAPAAIWRCAYNTSRHAWGHLARGFVIILIATPVLLAIVFVVIQ